jgi:hypothetical protein
MELLLLDRHVDPNDILPYDSSSSDVQMSDFRIAHEALAQAHSSTVRSESTV